MSCPALVLVPTHHAESSFGMYSNRELLESPRSASASLGSGSPLSSSGFNHTWGQSRTWQSSTWRDKDFRLDLSARPKNSAELVEKSKVDPEKFRIWHVGGRANTPLSYWKAWKRADLQTRPATTAGHVRSFLAVGPDIATGVQKTRPLDGAWISNEDGSLRGEVQGEVFHWACDGTASRLHFSGERQENLCLMVDGVRHFAVLSLDGRRISWADGDVWLRAESLDPEEVAFQETVKTQCESSQRSQEKLSWSEWKLCWRPNSDGPAWPRPSSVRRPRVSETPSVSMVCPVMPSIPALRGMIIIRR